MSTKPPAIVRNDPWLRPFQGVIERRIRRAVEKEKELTTGLSGLSELASGHLYFGLHRKDDHWVFREWAPNATAIYLTGDLSGWKEQEQYSLHKLNGGVWEIDLPGDALKHGDLYRLSIHWQGGQGDRIPVWTSRVVQDKNTLIFNAQVWDPEEKYNWQNKWIDTRKRPPIIYETHVGMSSEEGKTASFSEFRINVLPRIVRGGYNTIQLMAIQEHPYYGSFGYHVSSFFALSSRFGTPEELKALVDEAHSAGIAVIMDIVHSHSVKNEVEGLARFDGTPYQYFHDGYRREHIAWDSLCFNYGKNEVLHFLLSNCKYWLEEYRFDGFRFDGVTSMLYYDHGLSRDFTSYGLYFDGGQDEDAISYLMLANKLIKQVNPGSVTIAEEMSGMPGLAAPLSHGGMGFDYRLAMGIPDYWIKIIKERSDEQWNVHEIYHELTARRADEKTITYAESHDQALVGDKTIIFRLMDKEMYDFMDRYSTSLIIDRGLALHKMIRLVTISCSGGGYLNFMGNEFGHPEWIDFPRKGNNWSYHYARRQWSLDDNEHLKYQFLSAFDKDMIRLVINSSCLLQPWTELLLANNGDQVLAFSRAALVFVFNFNPVRSFTDYGIPVMPGKFRIVLNTDDPAYGGNGLVSKSMTYYTNPDAYAAPRHLLRLYLPARSSLVLERIPIKHVH
jgi:1,4-alpha-glucan branching enzyme